MAGLLTHLSIGILGALVIFLVFYRSEKKIRLIYGFSFVIANLLPDLVDFGILSIRMGSLNPDEIMTHKMFHTLAILGHTFSNWLIGSLVVLIIVMILSCLKKVSWKGFMKWVIGVILVLIGIAIHLTLDVLIQESSHWI